MKANNKMMKWLLLLLCTVMAAGVLTQAAGAAQPTDRCTNAANEGIEYFQPAGVLAEDANKWRGNLEVSAVTSSGYAGRVVAMELEVINSGTRYQCTEIDITSKPSTFSCNSMPNNAVISGVYFRLVPEVSKDTPFTFKVDEAFGSPKKTLMGTDATVKYPPYPCARNIFTKDLVAPTGNTLNFYTDKNCLGEVIGDQIVEFLEQEEQYAIVNIISGDTLVGDVTLFDGDTYTYADPTHKNRVMIDVLPDANFDYDLALRFETFTGTTKLVYYHYEWDVTNKKPVGYIDGTTLNGITQSDLPLTFKGGLILNLVAKEPDGWGIPAFPTDIDFTVRFWYENTEGTLGYENSIFHFERNINIQFSPTCTNTAPATALYDHCQATRQMFTSKLATRIPITKDIWSTNTKVNVKEQLNGTGVDLNNYYFMTRKCVNAACDWVTSTSAYLYSVDMSDGGGSNRTYTNQGVASDIGTRSLFKMRAFGTCTGTTCTDPADRPFAIVGARLVADEPGTYIVYAFAKYDARGKSALDSGDYKEVFYITINDKDQLDTCQTLANNGYFRANWNDCLDPRLTQLITFEQIPGKEEAWMENRSNTAVYFPYVQEWSYIPQKLQIASLTYKAEALSSAGSPGSAYCSPDGCYVPPYTRVYITGGTFYLESSPKYDEYRVAYARQDTWNISHLFFNIYVKECENKKIPNTGISLRSPLKVNEKVNTSVDPATSYVFTGNSLRIPAIGLGMETPIPIVHVYYEEGSDGMRWDLSTLGNYVGELEGGSYIPYGGNSVLTGHYFSAGVFKNLEHLNLEDEIIVYANDGVKYIYKVVQKFIAEPEDVYEMFQQVGDRSLTLVTCENYNIVTDEYERRQIVRAVLESQDIYEEGVW